MKIPSISASALFPLLLVSTNLDAENIEVRFLAWDSEIAARRLTVQIEDNPTRIEGLHHLRRSRKIVLPPPDPDAETPLISIAEEQPGSIDPPEVLPLDLPSSIRRPLVLILPADNQPLGLRLLVIEDDTDDFQWGSFRIFNTSRKELFLATRDQQVELPPGWEPTDFKLSGASNESVLIALEDANEGFKIIYSSIWIADPETRRIILIVPSTDSRLGAVSLRVIPEFRTRLSTSES